MKTIIVAFVLAAASTPVAADPWSSADIARESAYLFLHAIDWKQTRYASMYPHLFVEKNTILGEHPSKKRIDTYFLTTAILHVGAVHFMPKAWRPAFQYFWIGVEVGAVTNNYIIGIRLNH